MSYIDIHTHTIHPLADVIQLVNVFPGEDHKFGQTGYYSVGLHPWQVEAETWETKVEWVRSACGKPHVRAIGETGLDKVIAVPYALQQTVFEKQLALAESERKPMVIHCVRAFSEMLAYRKKSDQRLPWIFHWFNADIQIASELMRKNCYLSFGHMLFNQTSRACRVFDKLPVDRLFLETDDAGYTIVQIYERASLIRKMPQADLKSQIMDNFVHCFQPDRWKTG